MEPVRFAAECLRIGRYRLVCSALALAGYIFTTLPIGLLGAEGARPVAQITYTNIIDPRGPWSIHVVKVPRQTGFELRSVHAMGRAIGLSELSDQVRSVFSKGLEAKAAVNGDFFQREGAHAGDPRGLQIVDGEVISAPSGSGSFWIDALGEPQAANTSADFKVTWPDGSSTPFGLNGSREAEGIELFTPATGRTTRAERGRDLILEPEANGPWLPLRPGRTWLAKVRAVRDGANGEIAPGTMVLSIGPSIARAVPRVAAGAVLTLSTATKPDLRGARLAISGGPVLLKGGSIPSFRSRGRGGETSSINVQHPRSAVGWSREFYLLVLVDGRQRRSVGMTLPELSGVFQRLGCTDAMNLDGGGSATLWYDGKVRNRPCDGGEREIANSLVAVTVDKRGTDEPKQTKTASAE